MGFFRRSDGEKEAVSELRKADAELHQLQSQEKRAGIEPATSSEYQLLNDAANRAAEDVSWWRGGYKR